MVAVHGVDGCEQMLLWVEEGYASSKKLADISFFP